MKNIYVTEVEIILQEVEMERCHGVSPRWRVCRCFGIVRFHPQIVRGAGGEAEAKVRQDLEDEEDKRQKGKQIHFRAYFFERFTERETGRKRKRASSSLPCSMLTLLSLVRCVKLGFRNFVPNRSSYVIRVLLLQRHKTKVDKIERILKTLSYSILCI